MGYGQSYDLFKLAIETKKRGTQPELTPMCDILLGTPKKR
jgi:hypothetical protein